MKQEKLSKATKKAMELPLEFTQTILEKTKKVRTPSPKADKLGRTIGVGIGAVLILAGAVWLFIGKLPLAIGTAAAGGVTILSNTKR